MNYPECAFIGTGALSDPRSGGYSVSGMGSWRDGRLSDQQAALLQQWLPDARVRRDMSWNLVDTVVLDADTGRGRVVVKAAGPLDHHLGREITAFEGYTECLALSGHAARVLFHDRAAKVLVLTYLDGNLVEGSEAELEIDTHLRAGQLARTFHGQGERVDPDWDIAAVAKSLVWLDKPHRIDARTCADLRAVLAAHRPGPAVVVPTHGDWQPRNWLIDAGTVKVIDFGRFAWRPASSDFCRLAAQQWRRNPHLEQAFFDGYGGDPRSPDQWRLFAVHEAIGTAVWAFQVGDAPFEQQGHRMIQEALGLF